MKELIKNRLVFYMIENHPELMPKWEVAASMDDYLNHKVGLLDEQINKWEVQNLSEQKILELADQAFLQIMPRSTFHFIKDILQTEYPEEYAEFERKGILKTAVLSITKLSEDLLHIYDFQGEPANDRLLRYALIASIHDYLLS